MNHRGKRASISQLPLPSSSGMRGWKAPMTSPENSPASETERRTRTLLVVFLVLMMILPLFGSGISLLVDWIWFAEEGFGVIYRTTLKAKIAMSGWASLGFFLFAGVNILIARSVSRRYGFQPPQGSVEFPTLDRLGGVLKKIVWLGLALAAYGLGTWATSHWQDYLLFSNSEPFGEVDPLLGLDLGFYLFELPFIRFVFHWTLVGLVLTAIACIFFYLLEGGVAATPKGAKVAPPVRVHLLGLAGLFFLGLAYNFRLSMYDLLYSPRGVVFGASYTDVHASLPVYWILLGLSVLIAVSCFLAPMVGKLRYPVFGLVALVGVGFLGGKIYPELMQRFSVAPNEIEKEKEYIEFNIKFTQKAYGLDRFEERGFPAEEGLTLDSIRNNQGTISNIRLWDHKPLLSTFGQLQEIRPYYDFNDVDNDRYWLDGTYRQISLSPRELSYDDLPSKVWINQHMTYTHGYGLCLGPVNETTSTGQPNLFIKNIPPVSNVNLQVTRPEIYFGEMGNEYCVVKTNEKEFDRPPEGQETDNRYIKYKGESGLAIGSFWRRLLFALKFGELKFIFSDAIRDESRVMIYRRIQQRAERLTPFLLFDNDPYMVIGEKGRLWWILDGYTVSAHYPYSEPVSREINYIRNSVKVTINAYDGRTRFYLADPDDPIIRVYSKIFPGVFRPLDEMPKDLRAHMRYPQDLFSIQAEMYAVYHMSNPRIFYSREDLWRVAQVASGGGAPSPMKPYYTIMKLPEVGQTEEFILMTPFTPARKNNMIAWMAARCDGKDYGKVLVFNFPKQKLIYGPQQIESRIDQQPEISQQLSLWDQGGSKVIRGTLLVIPIENSLLYVEPLYLAAEATDGALPEMRRVIVSYADQVVMEESLEEALAQIFGGEVDGQALPQPLSPSSGTGAAAGAAPPTPTVSRELKNLAREANRFYRQAEKKLRQGDLAGYEAEIKKLGDVLRGMERQ